MAAEQPEHALASPLFLHLAVETMPCPRHGPQARQRDGAAAPLADTEGPCFEPRLRRLYLVELVALAAFEPPEEIPHGAACGVLEERYGLWRGKRGNLPVRHHDGVQEALTCLGEHPAKFAPSVRIELWRVRTHGKSPCRPKAVVSKRSPGSRPSTSTARLAARSPRDGGNAPTLLCLDRDRGALGRRGLGQRDGQQPVLKGCGDPAAVHGHGQADAAGEGPVDPLRAVVAVLLLFLLQLLLALDGQELLLERNVDVLRVHARDFRLDHHGVLGLRDVHARRPLARRRELVQLGVGETLEELLHLLPHAWETHPWHQRSHSLTSFSRPVEARASAGL